MGNLSSKRQELSGRLVDREVVGCVSQLISTLIQVSDEYEVDGLDYEALISICIKDDWEEPGVEFILLDADLGQLEEIANQFGDWDDLCDALGYGTYVETCEENDTEPDSFKDWIEGQDACHTAEESFTKALRREVENLVDDWDWVGEYFNLDPYTREAYEHWVVTPWLASKLEAKGEMVGDVLGLTVWGRCTSGASICIDGVIEDITAELWPEEWNGKEAA